MQQSLTKERCVACHRGAPTLSPQELESLRSEIPAWDVVEVDGEQRLERGYKLKNFSAALELTDKIGALAEEEGHHPALLTEWGRLKVSWWTHKIGGLHRNDVIMAAKTDELAAAAGAESG